MEKIINFIKQLDVSNIIEDIEISDITEEVRFTKGLLNFCIYKAHIDTEEFGLCFSKNEHEIDKKTGKLSGITVFDRTLLDTFVTDAEDAINLIIEYVSKTDLNLQREKWLKDIIFKFNKYLSKEYLDDRGKLIAESKRKRLEKYNNDLLIVTNFYIK